MARFEIKIRSRTGSPLGSIHWVNGQIKVSNDSNPLFLEAVEIMLKRGTPLPVREGDHLEHLSIDRGVFASLKNIKRFLEKSFGFKAIVAGADWNSDQFRLPFLLDEPQIFGEWVKNMLQRQKSCAPGLTNISFASLTWSDKPEVIIVPKAKSSTTDVYSQAA